MRIRWVAAACALSAMISIASPVTADCGGDNGVATPIANEGDRLRATNLDGAIEKYQEALQAAPQSHRIMWKLARAYEKKEAWDLVASTMAKASALAPKHAGYVELRGLALARLAEKDAGTERAVEAKAALEGAIALDPNLADAHYELADVSLRLRDEKSALVHYTKAIELAPDQAIRYAALADLYLRLGFDAQAERTLLAGEARVTDESKTFALRTLHGDLLDRRGDASGALAQYEGAKRACGACTGRGEQVAYFNLGAAYASVSPPRKSEAISNLQSFQKMICKGAAAARYADQCMQAQQLATKLGGTLQ